MSQKTVNKTLSKAGDETPEKDVSKIEMCPIPSTVPNSEEKKSEEKNNEEKNKEQNEVENDEEWDEEVDLYTAVAQNDMPAVKKIIEDENYESDEICDAVLIAIQQEKLDLIKYLISVEAPEYHDNTLGVALCTAAESGYFEAVKYLVEYIKERINELGTDVDKIQDLLDDLNEAIDAAGEAEQTEVVKYLENEVDEL